MIPSSQKSNVIMFSNAGQALREAGHSVDVLVEASSSWLVENAGLATIIYTEPLMSDQFLQDMLINPDVVESFAELTTATSKLVEGILQNDDIMSRLENRHYDVAVVDGLDFARALYVLPYLLGIRYVTLTTRHDPWNAGLPQLPSVESIPGIGNVITENSTMSECFQGLMTAIMLYLVMPSSVLDDSMIARYVPMRPKKTFTELFRNSEMWLCNMDTVCLERPLVHGNHYQFVTGLSLRQPKPLPAELEEFMRGSKAGVIVLTFGSGVKDIPSNMLERMLEAFSQIEQRVIMRHGGVVPRKLPGNVKMLSWIPQGDLLGHPNTRAFITHGGSKGQMEAIHNAVPMVTIPMFGDQPYNAKRVAHRGFGVTLDKEFTGEQLLQAIKTVTQDEDMRQNIRECSDRFRSFPSSHETVVFWVEHVIRFGGDHLKPVALRVPLFKRFMLDIIGIFILALLVICILFLMVCRRLYRKCLKPSSDLSTKKSEKTL